MISNHTTTWLARRQFSSITLYCIYSKDDETKNSVPYKLLTTQQSNWRYRTKLKKKCFFPFLLWNIQAYSYFVSRTCKRQRGNLFAALVISHFVQLSANYELLEYSSWRIRLTYKSQCYLIALSVRVWYFSYFC